MYLASAHAKGKASDARSLDLGAYLDVSISPMLPGRLMTDDWQRSRSLWARIGHDRVFKATAGAGPNVAEDRGIVALHGKVPLHASVWLDARMRADLR